MHVDHHQQGKLLIMIHVPELPLFRPNVIPILLQATDTAVGGEAVHT